MISVEVDISRALEIPGWMEREELRWLAEQANSHNLIVEVGAYLGRSTRAMADNLQSTSRIVTIDDWYGPRSDTKPNGELFTPDSRERLFAEFQQYLSPHLQTGQVSAVKADYDSLDEFIELDVNPDFVFIDGDHCYRAVKRDIEFWLKKMAPGSILSGHDSNYGDVTRAVSEIKTKVFYPPWTNIWATVVV